MSSYLNEKAKSNVIFSDLDESGVDAFFDSFDKAMDNINSKNKILTGIGTKSACFGCPYRKEMPVFPLGDFSSDMMVVSQDLTPLEAKVSTPYYDDYTRMFQILLSRLGIDRNSLYMTTLTKCCNHLSLVDVKYACANSYLMREILVMKPNVILTLGLDSTNVILELLGNKSFNTIEECRGTPIPVKVDFDVSTIIVPTYSLKELSDDFPKLKINFANDVTKANKLRKIGVSGK